MSKAQLEEKPTPLNDANQNGTNISFANVEQKEEELKDKGDNDYYLNKNHLLRVKVSEQEDLVGKRFAIELKQPLPQFDSGFANAYKVTDKKGGISDNLYALVFKRQFPIRLSDINKLIGKKIENFSNIVDCELVPLSTDKGRSFVAIVEKPQGIALTKYLEKNGLIIEDKLSANIIPQLNRPLAIFSSLGIVHGNINTDTIYINEIDNTLTLSECISEPCGFSQNLIYEQLDRATAIPIGKGEGDSKTDSYALGVVAAICLLGYDPTKTLKYEECLNLKFTKGTYHIITSKLKISPHMLDLLRGCINDKKSEIWYPAQVNEWARGRRFNLLPQASRVEATRPLLFEGKEYLNRKVLAHDLYLHWDTAKEYIKKDLLRKWIERSIQDTDKAEELESIAKLHKKKENVEQRFSADDEALFRTILALDPDGPLRLKNFSTNIDGLQNVIAYAFANVNKHLLESIADVLTNSLVNIWSEASHTSRDMRFQDILFSLQKSTELIRKRGLGFGIERCLYELNPTVCCQSPKILDRNVLNVKELLNSLSDTNIEDADFLDLHISSFLANRVELPSQIKIRSLDRFPDLAKNPYIQSVAMLSLAQDKIGKKPFKNLALKVAKSMNKVIDTFHSKQIREEMLKKLNKTTESGNFTKILHTITDSSFVIRDRGGFSKAAKRYKYFSLQIAKLSNKHAIVNMGFRYGLQLAVVVSFLAAALVMLVLTMKIL